MIKTRLLKEKHTEENRDGSEVTARKLRDELRNLIYDLFL